MKVNQRYKCEELLEQCDKAINRGLINKIKFIRFGFFGQYNKIIEIIIPSINAKDMFLERKDDFLKICGSRIRKIESTTPDNLTGLGILLSLFGSIVYLSTISEKIADSTLYIISLLFICSLLIIALGIIYHRSQLLAWYAIKEAALCMKDTHT